MLKENKKPFVILSLNVGNFRLEMDILHKAGIKEKQIKPVTGVITDKRGIKIHEKSYLIVHDVNQLYTIRQLARTHKQTCFLYVHGDRYGELQYMDNRVKRLGRFTEVSKFTAERADAYTFDHLNNKYYIC